MTAPPLPDTPYLAMWKEQMASSRRRARRRPGLASSVWCPRPALSARSNPPPPPLPSPGWQPSPPGPALPPKMEVPTGGMVGRNRIPWFKPEPDDIAIPVLPLALDRTETSGSVSESITAGVETQPRDADLTKSQLFNHGRLPDTLVSRTFQAAFSTVSAWTTVPSIDWACLAFRPSTSKAS